MYRKALFILLVLLVFTAYGCDETTDPAVTTRIAVIGDSISDGVNPQTSPTKYGWVHMISSGGSKNSTLRSIWSGAGVNNFSVSGSTAAQWNSTSWLAGAALYDPHITVVYIGGNDVLNAVNSGGFDAAAAATLSNNINGIVVKMKTDVTNTRIVLIGYYDLFDNLSGNLSGVSGFSQYSTMSGHVVTGNTMISNIARFHNAVYVPVREPFLGHAYGEDLGGTGIDPEYFRRPIDQFDIHPITSGHEKLADLVLEKFAGISL